MKTRPGTSVALWSALAAASVASCSLINAYNEDIVSLSTGAGAGGAADSGPGDESMAGSAGTGEVDAGGDALVVSTDADAAPMFADPGVIVIGGEEVSDGGARRGVLAVIDPVTGKELGTREAMNVGAIAYDGAPGRENIWFIFEDNPLDILAPAKVHVRSLNPKSGKWTPMISTLMLPPISADSVAVLNNRIAYLSLGPVDGGGFATGLAIISTDGAEGSIAPKLVESGGKVLNLPFNSTSLIVGLLGTRGTGADPGGFIDIVHGTKPPCPLGDAGIGVCNAMLSRVEVTQTGAGQPQGNGGDVVGQFPERVGNAGGGIAFAVDRTAKDNLMAFPPLDPTVPNAEGYVQAFTPTTHVAATEPRPFKVGGPWLRTMAMAECERVALTLEFITKPELFAVPLDPTGTPAAVTLLNSGQKIAFEPVTKTVLAPFKAGTNFELRAFTLEGGTRNQPLKAPMLVQRTAATALKWTPPADLAVDKIAVKAPATPDCKN